MSTTLPETLLAIIEGKIDFEGQKAVERVSRATLVAASVAAFVVGAAFQSLRVAFGIFGVAAALLFLVVLPPWPMYNRHPVAWLPAKEPKAS